MLFDFNLCYFKNGCSQSSRFPTSRALVLSTAGQGERSSGNEIGQLRELSTYAL